ncbi:hypothetical protein J437_LFUL017831 [Ladona fulva]|uniref:chitin synthase n=1 Tax=Ladona fulva TaxID=123851 RepID=A0A8K0KME2_LADFU|nr:hypothetical protein J437_LFUL017831 [Ladona fulva]
MARRQSLFLTREDLDEDDEDEMSDDEDSLLNENLNNEGSELRKWDVFQDLPPEEESGSTMEHKWIEVSMKIMKFLSYIISFCMVLGCGIIAKGCILFMTSQLKPGRVTEFCNRELGREKHFTSVIPEEERIAWTWSLLIAIAAPELGAFIRSFRICIFKFWKKPPFWDFMVVAIMETFHAIGVSLLIFCILPNLDVLRGAMLTNCVCFIPGVLKLLCRNEDNQEEYSELKSGENEVANRWAYNAKAFNEDLGNKQQSKPLITRLKDLSFKGWRLIILDVLAIIAQGTGFVIWPLSEGGSKPQLWAIPFALLFISAGWWENFVSTNSPISIVSSIGKIKERLKDTRYFIYSIVSIWKILVKTIYSDSNGIGADISDAVPVGESIQVDVSYQAPICVFTLQILSAYLCYVFGKFACKICIQEFSFAFPLNLTVPVTIILLVAMCVQRAEDACAYYGAIPDYLFFDSPSIYLIQNFVFGQHVWLWLFWLLSQAWITLHIWTPKHDRVASTEKLFDDDYLEQSNLNMNLNSTDSTIKRSDTIPHIFACVTMWHETKEEMKEMLKSVMRLDSDQSARHNIQQYFRLPDPDYYKLEVHIFFDDAFTINEDDEKVVNQFVKYLMETIDDAAIHVHEAHIKIRAPKKYPTPYGGRLVWTLPGKTKMVAHLKDKTRIRQKKRWSQVMYMYYLLGHRLMDRPIDPKRKEIRAENTFILALDGDIDFQPNSVQLLVDLMKKNRNLGAACGRIHPIGTGEDRWLCTLLLQRGHHVEYSAASDAYTHCPEGFNEFYNQRRRWVPSTMANIFDLLGDFNRTVENNANISTLYIIYQMVLMAGTVLGPGTIFLMLVGAFVAAFKIDNWTSFYYNLIPILIYMAVCFLCESKVQIEEEMKRKAEEAKKSGKTKSFLGFLGPAGANDQSGSFELSFAGLFKCMMCTHKDEKKAEEKELLLKISDSLTSLGKRLDGIDRIIDPRVMNSGRRRSVISTTPPSFLNTLQEEVDESKDDDQESDNSDSGSTVSGEIYYFNKTCQKLQV